MGEKKIYIIDNKDIIYNDEISKHEHDNGFYYDKISDGTPLFFDESLRRFKTDSAWRAYVDSDKSCIGKGLPYTGFLYNCGYSEEFSHYYLNSYQYYVHGFPVGIKVVFYENGNINRVTHEDSVGYLAFEWYENGVLKYEGYKGYLYREYDEGGTLIAEKKYLTATEKKYRDNFEFSLFYTPAHHFPKRLGYNDSFVKDCDTFFNEYRRYSDDECIKKALKNGAEVRPYVPDVLPDNMNPPQAIRKPVLLMINQINL